MTVGYYLEIDGSNNVVGGGSSFNGALPANAVACTQTESENWFLCTVAGGVITQAASPAPTLAQQAAALIAAGISITSTGTPALDGIYAIDAPTQTEIANEAQFISTFSEFTTGGTTNLPWELLDGSWVEFPTPTEFLAFAKFAAQFIAATKVAVGQNTALPASSATIP